MIKIGFKDLQLALFVISVCIVGTQCDRFNASVTCQPCQMACGVANCLRLAAPAFDQ
jgi:hypothetical protein